MQTKILQVAAELKADDEGIVEGYGSIFGNEDSYGDIVAPGAFEETLAEAKASGRLPAMLWQHDPSEPIGVWTDMAEDKRGLRVRGKFADTQRGREAFNLVKMGALSGLSIGYSTVGVEFDDESETRTLTKVKLWEVSPVTFPANDRARITRVKSVDIKTERDFERFLRDAGFSRTEAKRIARLGFDPSLRDAANESDAVDSISAALASLKSITRV